MKPKAIQDEMGETFDDYGRMGARLGLEVPFTNGANQNFVLQNYVDPSTEVLNENEVQIWKITHNGVDTHPVHFHLYDVQLINRVGWDGFVRLPDPNELGWKDTVRISPLEDTIVALRPVAPKQPFGLYDSVRPLNPATPLGSTMGFSQIDPLTGADIVPPTTNQFVNLGWEYVWHCHILSHEENDMMRSIVFNTAVALPAAPALSLSGTPGTPVNLTWTDGTPAGDPATLGNPANEIGYRIERADGAGAFASIGSALANVTGYTDNTTAADMGYQYRVIAYNAAGESTSNIVTITPAPPADPAFLIARALSNPLRVQLTWTDNAVNESGFVIERSVNGGAFSQLATTGPVPGTGTANYTDTAVTPGSTYTYQVMAVNAGGTSAYSNTASVTLSALPPASPSNVSVTAVVMSGTRDRLTMSWTDNSADENGFTIQRATNASFTAGRSTYTIAANVTVFQQNTNRGVTYYYRIRAFNASGASAWVNAVPFPITTP
jgi:hypothetical protein